MVEKAKVFWGKEKCEVEALNWIQGNRMNHRPAQPICQAGDPLEHLAMPLVGISSALTLILALNRLKAFYLSPPVIQQELLWRT